MTHSTTGRDAAAGGCGRPVPVSAATCAPPSLWPGPAHGASPSAGRVPRSGGSGPTRGARPADSRIRPRSAPLTSHPCRTMTPVMVRRVRQTPRPSRAKHSSVVLGGGEATLLSTVAPWWGYLSSYQYSMADWCRPAGRPRRGAHTSIRPIVCRRCGWRARRDWGDDDLRAAPARRSPEGGGGCRITPALPGSS